MCCCNNFYIFCSIIKYSSGGLLGLGNSYLMSDFTLYTVYFFKQLLVNVEYFPSHLWINDLELDGEDDVLPPKWSLLRDASSMMTACQCKHDADLDHTRSLQIGFILMQCSAENLRRRIIQS